MISLYFGCVDPAPFLPHDVRAIVESAAELLPDPPPGMAEYAGINREDQAEYAKLVARQFRCNRVALADHVVAGAPVFSVGKSGGGDSGKSGTDRGYLRSRGALPSRCTWLRRLRF